jgi:hypothetical protein
LARSLSEISTQDLCKRSLCKISAQCLWKRSFRKISVRDLLDLDSWQDLFAFSLSKSLRRISWTESALCHSKSDPTRTSQRLGKPWKTHGRHGAKGAANFLRLLLKPHFSCDFHDYMRLLGCGSHAFRIFIRKKCATCLSEGKTSFFPRFLFHAFCTFFSGLFHCCRKKTKHVKTVTWTCNIFPRLATFGHDMRLLSQSHFFLTTWFPRYAKQRTSCICH